MAAYSFTIPPTIRYGEGALACLGETTRALGLHHVLLVTDAGVVRLGIAERARELLHASGVGTTLFDGVDPDPTLLNVEAGLALLRQDGCEGLVAVGGGSSIDCAKGIAVAATHPEPLPGMMGVEKIPRPGLPVVAVPTTAGTGSEVSRMMVLTDTVRDVKMLYSSDRCLPAVALVDPELSYSMPKSLTAAVGVDALAHGIESYVSRHAHPMTDQTSLTTIRLIYHNLRAAYRDGSDRTARGQMMLGAMYGGMSFSNASVALVHGMARPLGACFHQTHGVAIGLLLPVVTAFSIDAAPERYARIAAEMGITDLVAALRELNAEVGIPSLRSQKIEEARYESLLEKMAVDAIASGSPANNPRPADVGEIVALYRQLYAEG